MRRVLRYHRWSGLLLARRRRQLDHDREGPAGGVVGRSPDTQVITDCRSEIAGRRGGWLPGTYDAKDFPMPVVRWKRRRRREVLHVRLQELEGPQRYALRRGR